MGECSFWYRPTRVVPDQRPLNGRCCCFTFLVPAHPGSPGKGPLNGCVCVCGGGVGVGGSGAMCNGAAFLPLGICITEKIKIYWVMRTEIFR